MSVTEQAISAAPALDAAEELHRDLVGNGFAAVKQRERYEALEQTQRAALAGENAAARYRKLTLMCPQVTDAEFRVLSLIVEKADPNLTNSFASPEWLQKRLGGRGCKRKQTHKGAENGRRTVGAIYKAIASLVRKGFLRWHNGRGWQLRLPPGVLAPGADAWNGPRDWSNRWSRDQKEVRA